MNPSYYSNSYTQQLSDPTRGTLTPGHIFPQADVPALIQDPCTGAVYMNPSKSFVKWFYLSGNPFPLPLPADGQLPVTITPPLENGSDGDMEVVKMTSTSTGRFGVMIEDTVTNRRFMNQPVANNLVFGTSQMPFTLFESIWLPASTNLQVQCSDLSGAPNDIRIVTEGRRFIGCGPKEQLWSTFFSRRTHPYWLTFDNGPEVTVEAGATLAFTMTVPAAGDFNCFSIMDDSSGDYEMKILENSSGRSMMGGPGENGQAFISAQNFVASPTVSVAGFPGGVVRAASLPHTWTFSHVFKRASQVVIVITNPGGAPIDVRLAFHGQMIYYGECPGLADPSRSWSAPAVPMPAPANWLPCSPPGCGPGQGAPVALPNYGYAPQQAPQLPMVYPPGATPPASQGGGVAQIGPGSYTSMQQAMKNPSLQYLNKYYDASGKPLNYDSSGRYIGPRDANGFPI